MEKLLNFVQEPDVPLLEQVVQVMLSGSATEVRCWTIRNTERHADRSWFSFPFCLCVCVRARVCVCVCAACIGAECVDDAAAESGHVAARGHDSRVRTEREHQVLRAADPREPHQVPLEGNTA